eukprot:m51a1_g119 putative serine-protein kinase atm (4596) ;mRNA; f:366111-398227
MSFFKKHDELPRPEYLPPQREVRPDKVDVKINGKEISVPANWTVQRACRENGIYVPSLCNFPSLAPTAKCGVCVVHIDGRSTPYVQSCKTVVEHGMRITTNTPDVQHQARANLVEFLGPFRRLEQLPRTPEIEDLVRFVGSDAIAQDPQPPHRFSIAVDQSSCVFSAGFDLVFDATFASDICASMEAAELTERLDADGPFPMFSSSCPGWKYPHLRANLARVKSPMMALGALIRNWMSKRERPQSRDTYYVVAVMPCPAKKEEAMRSELRDPSGRSDVDVVLTTREMARLLRQRGVKWDSLPGNFKSAFDEPFASASGGGALTDASGGTSEAVLRVAHSFIARQDITHDTSRLFADCRRASELGDWSDIQVAVAPAQGRVLDIAVLGGSPDIAILYGSQGGTTATCAKQLAQFMARWVTEEISAKLPTVSTVLLVTSSWHSQQGSMPDNAREFYSRLRSVLPTSFHESLLATKFAVCGFGSTKYDRFCGFAEQLNSAFINLGATPFVEMVKIDTERPDKCAPTMLVVPSIMPSVPTRAQAFPGYHQVTVSRVKEYKNLTQATSGRYYYVEFDTGKTFIETQPDEYVFILPMNPKSEVESLLNALYPNMINTCVSIVPLSGNIRQGLPPHLTIRQMFEYYLDLSHKPTLWFTKRMVQLMGEDVDPALKEVVKMDPSAFRAWAADRTPYTPINLEPPRPRTIGICVKLVSRGFCSHYLSNLKKGDSVLVRVGKSEFARPSDVIFSPHAPLSPRTSGETAPPAPIEIAKVQSRTSFTGRALAIPEPPPPPPPGLKFAARRLMDNPIHFSVPRLTFGGLDRRLPVDEKVVQKFEVINHSKEKLRFWIPVIDTDKYKITFNPDSGVIKPSFAVSVMATIIVHCTTVFDGEVRVFCDNVTRMADMPDSGPKSLLALHVETKLSTKLDWDEITKIPTPIGKGGYGTVYRAQWRGQEVALKVLKAQDPSTEELKDFKRECQVLSELRSPYIVSFVGYITLPGKLSLVTEFLPLGSLGKYIAKGDLTLQYKLKSALDCARGMTFLHSCGIIHRDLKPDNLLVCSLDCTHAIVCKIADFVPPGGSKEDGSITNGAGTPIYMAPEVFRGEKYTVSADVYSFAMLLWELFSSTQPFSGPEFSLSWNVAQFVTEGKRLPLSLIGNEHVANLVRTCWDHNPVKRPTFDNICMILEPLLEKLGVRGVGDSAAIRKVRRRRTKKPRSKESSHEDLPQTDAFPGDHCPPAVPPPDWDLPPSVPPPAWDSPRAVPALPPAWDASSIGPPALPPPCNRSGLLIDIAPPPSAFSRGRLTGSKESEPLAGHSRLSAHRDTSVDRITSPSLVPPDQQGSKKRITKCPITLGELSFEAAALDEDSPMLRDELRKSEANLQGFCALLKRYLKTIDEHYRIAAEYSAIATQFLRETALISQATGTTNDKHLNELSEVVSRMAIAEESVVASVKTTAGMIVPDVEAWIQSAGSVSENLKAYMKASDKAEAAVIKMAQLRSTSAKAEESFEKEFREVRAVQRKARVSLAAELSLHQLQWRYKWFEIAARVVNANQNRYKHGAQSFVNTDQEELIKALYKESDERARAMKKARARVKEIVSLAESDQLHKLQTANAQDEPMCEISGYLFKCAANMKNWQYRYFQVSNGQLNYFTSGKDTRPITEVDIVLTTLRPRPDAPRRHCFEIISPDNSFILQADSDESMRRWMSVIDRARAKRLEELSPNRDKQRSPSETATALEAVWKLSPENKACADCGADKPDWFSINLGVLFCINCSGTHRSLGVHVSKSRSLKLDVVEPEAILLLARLGNRAVNAIYESKWTNGRRRPTNDSPEDERSAWIRDKYIAKAFMEEDHLGTEQRNRLLIEATSRDDIPHMLMHIAHGADINTVTQLEGFTPLHIAVRRRLPLAVAFLVYNNASLDVEDASGCTPLHYALTSDALGIASMLLKAGADTSKPVGGLTIREYADTCADQRCTQLIRAALAVSTAMPEARQGALSALRDVEGVIRDKGTLDIAVEIARQGEMAAAVAASRGGQNRFGARLGRPLPVLPPRRPSCSVHKGGSATPNPPARRIHGRSLSTDSLADMSPATSRKPPTRPQPPPPLPARASFGGQYKAGAAGPPDELPMEELFIILSQEDPRAFVMAYLDASALRWVTDRIPAPARKFLAPYRTCDSNVPVDPEMRSHSSRSAFHALYSRRSAARLALSDDARARLDAELTEVYDVDADRQRVAALFDAGAVPSGLSDYELGGKNVGDFVDRCLCRCSAQSTCGDSWEMLKSLVCSPSSHWVTGKRYVGNGGEQFPYFVLRALACGDGWGERAGADSSPDVTALCLRALELLEWMLLSDQEAWTSSGRAECEGHSLFPGHQSDVCLFYVFILRARPINRHVRFMQKKFLHLALDHLGTKFSVPRLLYEHDAVFCQHGFGVFDQLALDTAPWALELFSETGLSLSLLIPTPESYDPPDPDVRPWKTLLNVFCKSKEGREGLCKLMARFPSLLERTVGRAEATERDGFLYELVRRRERTLLSFLIEQYPQWMHDVAPTLLKSKMLLDSIRDELESFRTDKLVSKRKAALKCVAGLLDRRALRSELESESDAGNWLDLAKELMGLSVPDSMLGEYIQAVVALIRADHFRPRLHRVAKSLLTWAVETASESDIVGSSGALEELCKSPSYCLSLTREHVASAVRTLAQIVLEPDSAATHKRALEQQASKTRAMCSLLRAYPYELPADSALALSGLLGDFLSSRNAVSMLQGANGVFTELLEMLLHCGAAHGANDPGAWRTAFEGAAKFACATLTKAPSHMRDLLLAVCRAATAIHTGFAGEPVQMASEPRLLSACAQELSAGKIKIGAFAAFQIAELVGDLLWRAYKSPAEATEPPPSKKQRRGSDISETPITDPLEELLERTSPVDIKVPWLQVGERGEEAKELFTALLSDEDYTVRVSAARHLRGLIEKSKYTADEALGLYNSRRSDGEEAASKEHRIASDAVLLGEIAAAHQEKVTRYVYELCRLASNDRKSAAPLLVLDRISSALGFESSVALFQEYMAEIMTMWISELPSCMCEGDEFVWEQGNYDTTPTTVCGLPLALFGCESVSECMSRHGGIIVSRFILFRKDMCIRSLRQQGVDVPGLIRDKFPEVFAACYPLHEDAVLTLLNSIAESARDNKPIHDLLQKPVGLIPETFYALCHKLDSTRVGWKRRQVVQSAQFFTMQVIRPLCDVAFVFRAIKGKDTEQSGLDMLRQLCEVVIGHADVNGSLQHNLPVEFIVWLLAACMPNEALKEAVKSCSGLFDVEGVPQPDPDAMDVDINRSLVSLLVKFLSSRHNAKRSLLAVPQHSRSADTGALLAGINGVSSSEHLTPYERELIGRAVRELVRLCEDGDECSVQILHQLVSVRPISKAIISEGFNLDTEIALESSIEDEVLEAVADYFFSDNLTVSRVARDTARALLATPEGHELWRKHRGSAVYHILSPYSPKKPPSRSATAPKRMPGQLWDVLAEKQDHRAWVCELACALAEGDKGSVFRSCAQLCKIRPEFSEFLLGRLLEDCCPSDGNIAAHLAAMLTIEERDRMGIVRAILSGLDYMRKKGGRYWEETPDLWGQLDLLLVSRAALRCGSHASALQYIEGWCEQHLQRDSVPIRVPERSHGVSADQSSLCSRLLLEALSGMDEPDGINGVDRRLYHSDVDVQLLTYHHRPDWTRALALHEAVACRASGAAYTEHFAGILECLKKLGHYHIADKIAERADLANSPTLYDARCEAAWRAGDWSFVAPAQPTSEGTQPPLNRCILQSLKALASGDLGGVRASHSEACSWVVRQLRSGSKQSTRHIMPALCQLQMHAHILAAAQAQASRSEPVWPPLHTGDASDFDIIEPVLSLKASLLRILGRVDDIPPVLCLKAKLARKAGRFSIASESLQRLAGTGYTELQSFESSKLMWAQGEQQTAIAVLRGLRDDSTSSEIAVRATCTLGKWLAQSRTERSSVVQEVLSSAAESGRSAKAHFTLAQYTDMLYQNAQARMKSEEWAAAETLRKEREELKEKLRAIVEERRRSRRSGQRTQQELADENRLAKEQKACDLALRPVKQLEEDCTNWLCTAARGYLMALRGSDQYDMKSVFRLCSLWFAERDNEKLIELLETAGFLSIPSAKFLPLVYQIASRVSDADESGFQSLLQRLLFVVGKEQPHRVLWVLFALTNGGRFDPKGKRPASLVQQDKVAAAGSKLSLAVAPSQIAFQDVSMYKDRTERHADPSLSTTVTRYSYEGLSAAIPTAPLPSTPGESFVYARGFNEKFKLPGGINLPKAVVCRGSDGRAYAQLVKSNDDLRQDAVMEQVFEMVNLLLEQSPRARERKLHLRTYRVIPLSPTSGIVEWVSGTISCGNYLVGSKSSPEDCAHHRYSPKDPLSAICRAKMDKVKDKSTQEKFRVYESITASFHPAMRWFFVERYGHSPQMWFARRLAYTRSVAANSILGYIVGLGDRHSQNILIDENTAELVHIDLGVAFEQGKMLATPELVPFRLTRDIVDGMGVTGCEGVFRRCCEETMRVLRSRHQELLTILGVLVHDPLYNWTITAGLEYGDALSIEGQVNQLISEAQDPYLLCQMFGGWAAWI